MGCRILVGHEAGCDREIACFFCSMTGVAFGPIFDGEYDPSGAGDAHDEADAFNDWLDTHPPKVASGLRPPFDTDPRAYPVEELIEKYGEFCKDVLASRKAVTQ